MTKYAKSALSDSKDELDFILTGNRGGFTSQEQEKLSMAFALIRGVLENLEKNAKKE